MQSNRGVSSLLVFSVIIIVVILVGTGSFFFINNSKKEVPVQESIENALATDSRAHGVKPSEVVINKREGQFARGVLVDLNDGKIKTFYVIQIGDLWRVADVTEGAVSCERFTRIGFPADFIPDCQLSFPDAVTVAEIDATIDKALLEGAPLQFIGLVTEITINDEEGTITLVISSGGEETTIQSNIENVQNIDAGDIVVITAEVVVEPNQDNDNNSSQQNGGGVTISITNVTEVGDGDDEVTDPGNTNSLPQENEDTTNTQNNGGNNQENEVGGTGGVILKINAPVTAPPAAQFFNAFDIDTSFEDISIEGSF